jgi:hypothetical protein
LEFSSSCSCFCCFCLACLVAIAAFVDLEGPAILLCLEWNLPLANAQHACLSFTPARDRRSEQSSSADPASTPGSASLTRAVAFAGEEGAVESKKMADMCSGFRPLAILGSRAMTEIKPCSRS